MARVGVRYPRFPPSVCNLQLILQPNVSKANIEFMLTLFSEAMRRDPYPVYQQMRSTSPVLYVPPFDSWLLFDYESVKRAMNDHEAFSSRVGPEWLLFLDPPRHTQLRALISKAFTPRMVANLEPRIRELSRDLINQTIERGEMDLAADYSAPLPMSVIAEMIGIPIADRPRFQRWSDAILRLSDDLLGNDDGKRAVNDFRAVTVEMDAYLADLAGQRRAKPLDDLLTRLVGAEVEGERLSHKEIVNFVQILLVGGQETTTNLINNAILCLIENPEQLDRLKTTPGLMSLAIEEVLRYRSPFQWTPRITRQDVEMHGQVIPAGKRVLAFIGSANHDTQRFKNPDRFDITRDPNPHIAFGHGIHSCLGAALARLEARIVLPDLLGRLHGLELASREPWEPRKALHVHGPVRLPIRFQRGTPCGVAA
jgi:cytochrome P450